MNLAEGDGSGDEEYEYESGNEDLKIADVAEFAGWRVKDQDDEGVECGDNASCVERKFRNEKIPSKSSADDCIDVCANAACLCDGIDD
jgi:hypothetical protein